MQICYLYLKVKEQGKWKRRECYLSSQLSYNKIDPKINLSLNQLGMIKFDFDLFSYPSFQSFFICRIFFQIRQAREGFSLTLSSVLIDASGKESSEMWR